MAPVTMVGREPTREGRNTARLALGRRGTGSIVMELQVVEDDSVCRHRRPQALTECWVPWVPLHGAFFYLRIIVLCVITCEGRL